MILIEILVGIVLGYLLCLSICLGIDGLTKTNVSLKENMIIASAVEVIYFSVVLLLSFVIWVVFVR